MKDTNRNDKSDFSNIKIKQIKNSQKTIEILARIIIKQIIKEDKNSNGHFRKT